MKRIASAACTSIALVAALALFTVGCASTSGVGESKKAPAGYRYVCNCGPTCSCGSNAAKPGNCVCGKPMALKKVLVEKGSAYYVCSCTDCRCDAKSSSDLSRCSCGKALQSFPKRGAYTCACAGCECDMQANTPGKCVCGTEMKPRQQ